MAHFEDLWEQSEKLHQESDTGADISQIVDELMIKINLYKAIDLQTEIPAEDRKKIKSRTLTHVSLKDNINVFESLNTALRYRSVEYYSKKYSQ
jgi:hypothetical protein